MNPQGWAGVLQEGRDRLLGLPPCRRDQTWHLPETFSIEIVTLNGVIISLVVDRVGFYIGWNGSRSANLTFIVNETKHK